MHAVYIACLVGGAVATTLFAVLGWAGGLAHGGHVHIGHGHAAGPGAHAATSHGHAGNGHVHAQHGATDGSPSSHSVSASLAGVLGWTLSWLSPLTLAAAALWFGGIGLLAEGSALALIFAIIAALIGATLVRAAMGAFLRSSTSPLFMTADGAMGTVNATIRPNAPGEVVYTLEGLHRSLPARSEDGSSIPRGTAVVITRREGGFAWVLPLDPLDSDGSGDAPGHIQKTTGDVHAD